MNLVPGDSFEQRYEIRSELGGSEFSVVYRATSTDTGRDVVVRVLLPPPQGGYPSGFDARFIAEAKHVAKLKHAGTVKLESFGAASNGALYLVTEFISGTNLADASAEQPVSAADAVGLIIRLAESLGEAHARGIVHRELKPENIVVPLRRGVLGAKLRDFGVTKYVDDDGPVTNPAAAFGSPRYISPEQVMGRAAGPASNIYSLGLIFFELLAGEPCVQAGTAREMMSTHLSTTEFEIPATVPDATVDVLRRMIAKDEADRYVSTDELAEALKSIDRTKLESSRARRVVRSLERADAHGIGESTLIDPMFLDSSDVPTRERMQEGRVPRGASRQEVLTPTNIVAASDVRPPGSGDKTLLSDAPTMENDQPTDELDGQQKPNRARRHTGPRRADDTLDEEKKPARRPPKRRTPPPPSRQEERVSPWFAIAAMVAAVGLALGVTWFFTRPKLEEGDPARVRKALQVNPFAAQDDPNAANFIPELPAPTPDVGVVVKIDLGDAKTGCGIERPAGWAKATEVVGLTESEHTVYVPKSYDGTPSALILVAHPPHAIRGRRFVETTAMQMMSENLGAILVVPVSGSLRPWLDDPVATEQEFDRVLSHATSNYCIDQTQVFGVGMSTGAAALDAFSCAHPGRLSALALVGSWVQPNGFCPHPDPAARLYINGQRDRVSPFTGGPGCYGTEVRLPMPEVMQQLKQINGCGEEQVWEEFEAGTCFNYKGCETPLAHCVVPEGQHNWFGTDRVFVPCFGEYALRRRIDGFPTTQIVERFLKARWSQ